MRKNQKITTAQAMAERKKAQDEARLERERATVVYGSAPSKKRTRYQKVSSLLTRLQRLKEETRAILRGLRPESKPADAAKAA